MADASRALELLLTAETGKLEKKLDSAGGKIGGLGSKLGKIGGPAGMAGKAIAGVGAAGVAAGAAAGAAIVGIGVSAATEARQGVNNLQASLGITEEEAKKLGEVGKAVFKNAWGESLLEANQVVGETKKLFGDLSDQELQQVTEQAFSMRDAFGGEVGPALQGAQRLAGAFGIEASQAMDIIAKGAQTTGEEIDEVAILFQEYSGHLAQLGIDGPAALSAIESGMAAGAYEGDKVLDMFKEMNIKISEGSDATREALGRLGIDERMVDKFREGKISGVEMFSTIQGAIKEYEGNIPADLLADTLGTPAEDLGVEVVKALDLMGGSMEELEGTAAKAGDAVNKNWGTMVEGIKRRFQTGLGDAFGPLLEKADELMPRISEAVLPLVDKFTGAVGDFLADIDVEAMATMFEEDIVPAVQTGIDTFADFAQGAIKEIPGIIESIKSKFEEWKPTLDKVIGFIAEHKGTIAKIAIAFGALSTAAGILAPIFGLLSGAIGVIGPIIGGLVPIITGIVGVLGGPLTIAILAIVGLFLLWKAKGDEIKEAIKKVVEKLKERFDEMKEKISDALGRIFAKISEVWTNIKETIFGVLSSIWENIRLMWDSFLRTISEKLDAILGTVKTAWETVSSAISGALEIIGDVLTTMWDSFVTLISGTMETMKTTISGAFDAIKGIISGAMDAVKGIIDWYVGIWIGIFDKVGEIAGKVWGYLYSNHDSVYHKVTGALGKVRDAIATTIQEWIDKFANLGQRIKDKVGDIYDQVISIGEDVINGIKEGINKAIGGVSGIIRKAMDLVLGWLRDEAGTQSPSKYTIRIGEDLAAGIGVGIERGAKKLEGQIRWMALGLRAVFEDSFGDWQSSAIPWRRVGGQAGAPGGRLGTGGISRHAPGSADKLAAGLVRLTDAVDKLRKDLSGYASGGLSAAGAALSGAPWQQTGGVAGAIGGKGRSASVLRGGRGGFLQASKANYWRKWVDKWGVPDEEDARKMAAALGIPIPDWLDAMWRAQEPPVAGEGAGGGLPPAPGGLQAGGAGGGSSWDWWQYAPGGTAATPGRFSWQRGGRQGGGPGSGSLPPQIFHIQELKVVAEDGDTFEGLMASLPETLRP